MRFAKLGQIGLIVALALPAFSGDFTVKGRALVPEEWKGEKAKKAAWMAAVCDALAQGVDRKQVSPKPPADANAVTVKREAEFPEGATVKINRKTQRGVSHSLVTLALSKKLYGKPLVIHVRNGVLLAPEPEDLSLSKIKKALRFNGLNVGEETYDAGGGCEVPVTFKSLSPPVASFVAIPTAKGQVKVSVRVTNEGLGIKEIRLVQNGRSQTKKSQTAWEDKDVVDEVFAVTLAKGPNEFQLVAFSRDGMEGPTALTMVTGLEAVAPAKPLKKAGSSPK